MSTTPPRSMRTATIAVITGALLVAVVLAGCGSSGRALRDPKPGATAPARKNTGSTTNTAAGAVTTAGPVISGTALSFTTAAWSTGGTIPKAYTCDGANTSPPLSIGGAPTKAVELVLVVTNQNVSGQSLWILAGIGPATTSIPQGGIPTGAIQIVNSSGTARWTGPCPTPGPNTYEFALYALNSASGLTAESTRAQVETVIAGASSASVFTGTYKR